MTSKSLVAAALWSAASFVSAQVEIVDRPITESTVEQGEQEASNVPADIQPANNVAELFYQIQVLQQEMLELRGQVEEQSHLIKQLKQQRLDDYVDLDRRIAALGTGAAAATASSSTASTTRSSTTSPDAASAQAATNADAASEMAHYKSATKLILVDKNYDAGVERLQEHLALYPKGRFAGNAMYWLGEVQLAKAELPESQQWFERLLAEFPEHSKANDAKYKLATVYFQQGQADQAKPLLDEVAASNSSAAKLAQSYLRKNF